MDAEDANGVVVSAYFDDVLDRPTKVVRAANIANLRNQLVFEYDDANRLTRTIGDSVTFNDRLRKNEALFALCFPDAYGSREAKVKVRRQRKDRQFVSKLHENKCSDMAS